MGKNEVKRVLLLAGLMSSHATTRYTLTLAKALKQRDVQVRVVCARGSLVHQFQDAHIPVDVVRYVDQPILHLISSRTLVGIVSEGQPQVIHAQNMGLARTGARLAQATGLPLVVTALRTPIAKKDRWLVNPLVRRIIAVNEAIREDLVNLVRVPKDRIVVVPEGIDVSEYRMWSGSDAAVSPIVGIVAPLERAYGFDYFLAAAKLIHTAAPDIQFLIAGDGSLEGELRRQVRQLGLTKNVVFATRVGDYRPFLEVLDILVLPAIQEGVTFSIMEAMAMGKVVIVSSLGGLFVLVKNEETGFLVGRGDTAEIARRVLELVKNRTLTRTIGQNARKFVEQNFGPASLALRTLRVYEEALAE